MKKKYFATCIFLILFLFASISLLSAPQTFTLEGKVDLEIVKFIAQKMAEATWGKCSIGPIIRCLSADENLSSYLVVLRLGTIPCPSHEEILLEVDKRQQAYQNIINSVKSIKNEKQSIQQIFKNTRRKLWGVGEYCTVVVSANYEGFPIPRYFQGLPAYYVNFKNSKDIAENIIGRSQLRVDYYNLGHGGEYFLYTYEVNDLLIDAYSLKVKNEGKNFLVRQLPWGEPNEEVKKQISESWSYWLKLYQEK